MEEWQQNIIIKNLPKLIKYTICNVYLLSNLQQSKILSQEEVDILDKIPTALAKSLRLYTILLTRKGSFEVLQLVLKEIHQSGALDILNSKNQEFGQITVNFNHLLGIGRSGTRVYKGYFDGREVAVKVVKEDPEQVISEINTLKRIDKHENIVRYFFTEFQSHRRFIALELCLITLEKEMHKPVVKPDPKYVLKRCTKAVKFLHENNIIHGNLQPTNILLDHLGQVKICGFGCSKELEAKMLERIISDVYGTADWMAPEIYAELASSSSENVVINRTCKSDIFSLGCVFYFVLSGGMHLFGELFERQYFIKHDMPQWRNILLEDSTKSLISRMILPSPTQRPSPNAILGSVFFRPGALSEKTLISQSENVSFAEQEVYIRHSHAQVSETFNVQKETCLYTVQAISSQSDIVNAKCEKGVELQSGLDSNIDVTDDDGNTLLHIAILKCMPIQFLTLLINLGANFRAVNKNGQTGLHLASSVGNYNALEYLVSLGVDINARNFNKETPLHQIRFAKKHFAETLAALFKHGADKNATDIHGRDMMELAVLKGLSSRELQEIVKVGKSFKDKHIDKNIVL